MSFLRQRRRPAYPPEDFGLTPDDLRAVRESILSGGPQPASDVLERYELWVQETTSAKEERVAAAKERRRKFWHGVSTLAGIAAVVVLTVGVIGLNPVHISDQTAAALMIVGFVVGLLALFGLGYTERK